jgi:hypothetical protein
MRPYGHYPNVKTSQYKHSKPMGARTNSTKRRLKGEKSTARANGQYRVLYDNDIWYHDPYADKVVRRDFLGQLGASRPTTGTQTVCGINIAYFAGIPEIHWGGLIRAIRGALRRGWILAYISHKYDTSYEITFVTKEVGGRIYKLTETV